MDDSKDATNYHAKTAGNTTEGLERVMKALLESFAQNDLEGIEVQIEKLQDQVRKAKDNLRENREQKEENIDRRESEYSGWVRRETDYSGWFRRELSAENWFKSNERRKKA